MSDEIGRQLRLDELQPKRIVVIAHPGRPGAFMTMWVEEVADDHVVFFSGVMNWHVMIFVRDGELFDDQDRVVRVFEYLGEP